MTFDARETSVEGGQPVELYHFQIGSTHYYYTSSEDTVTFSGHDYVARQISRSSLSQEDGNHRNNLRVTLPSQDAVCVHYIGVVPGEPMLLTLIRFHRADSEAYNLWSGRVVGASFGRRGAVCELSCLTSESAFSRPLPRFRFQGLCNHVLYDGNCGVNKNSFKFTGTVDAVAGSVVTIPGLAAAKGAGWAVGGYISLNDVDYRLVVAQTGDDLTITLPFSSLAVGQSVDVFAGCDHTLTTCGSKFSNTVQYGGFPFVPTTNPFQTGLR